MAKKTKAKQNGASAASKDYSAYTAASALAQTEPRYVTQIGQASIFGGTTELLGRVPHLKLVLDLSSCPPSDLPSPPVEGNGPARKELPEALFLPPVPVLQLNWTDGQAGRVDMEWWLELIRWIETLKAPANVGVGCMGGRGRTGTALAVLGSLSGQAGEADPVEWVRDHYMTDAVETEPQIQYIEYVTGKRVYEWAADDLLQMKWDKYDWPEAPDKGVNASAFDDYGAWAEAAGPVVLGPPDTQDNF